MSDSLSHSCPTCQGPERKPGYPPHANCPDCVEGYPKDRIERAKRAVSDRMSDRRVDRYIEDPDICDEAVEDFALAAIRAFHTEGTD